MILEQQIENNVLTEGETQESIGMSLDLDSAQILMQMLSKNLYSDAIGSAVRECASNALDSKRRSKSEDPIIVSFKQNKDGNYEFSVEDFGTGLDDVDVRDIISKYGKSTKRGISTELGMMGLGFKAPLAYSSSFYFVCRKNGMERKYMMYEGETVNTIDLLYETETSEKNGVKVIIPVKYSDRSEFYSKIKEQLAYFEDIYFDCGEQIKNENVKIIRNENFQWSSLVNNDKLHICLDNVYYNINFDKLGIDNDIYFPVGLRFSLSDGIFPLPNREEIRYTKEAKEIILKKITLVADHFVAKYNESIKDTDDVFAILDYYQNSGRKIPHLSGIGWMDVQTLKSYSKITFLSPKLNNIKLLDIKRIFDTRDYLLNEYVVKYSYYNGRFNTEKNNSYRQRINLDQVKRGEIYLFSEISGIKKHYLRDTLGYSRKYFVRKDKSFKLGNIKFKYTGRGYEDYATILQLYNYPKNEWRQRIKEYQYIISLISSKFIDVDKMDIPQEWIDGRKKERIQKMIVKGTNVRRKKLTGEITGKEAKMLERYVSRKNCKFVTTVYQMKDAHKSGYFLIYGTAEDESLIQNLYPIFIKKKVKFVIFSERELKNLKTIELHNWMEIGKFMEGKHKIFRRAVTAYLINDLKKNYNPVFTRIKNLKEISTILGEKVEKLDNYNGEYYLGGSEDLYKQILKVAEEHNLFDTSIYDIYKEVKFVLSRLPFIFTMFNSMSAYGDNTEMIKAVRDLFKYYKQRIDWQHYNIPINEEIVVEPIPEVLEEELIEI